MRFSSDQVQDLKSANAKTGTVWKMDEINNLPKDTTTNGQEDPKKLTKALESMRHFEITDDGTGLVFTTTTYIRAYAAFEKRKTQGL